MDGAIERRAVLTSPTGVRHRTCPIMLKVPPVPGRPERVGGMPRNPGSVGAAYFVKRPSNVRSERPDAEDALLARRAVRPGGHSVAEFGTNLYERLPILRAHVGRSVAKARAFTKHSRDVALRVIEWVLCVLRSAHFAGYRVESVVDQRSAEGLLGGPSVTRDRV